MTFRRYIYIIGVITVLTIVGCTGKGFLHTKEGARGHDTIYTVQSAMNIHAYQPMRALHC